MARPLSWKAVRKGPRYCAPACGGGCTVTMYNAAVLGSRELAKRLGAGWEPHVWENLGWHYKAISPCGRIKVHPYIIGCRAQSYSAFLGSPGVAGGRWVGDGGTPERAVRDVVRIAKRELRSLGAVLEGL
jgi:hypothetical protein